MDAQRLDGHKKVLGILYIISSVLTIFGMLLLNAILSLVFSFAFDEMDADEQRVAELVMAIAQYLPAIIIFVFSLPTLIAGIGLLTRQGWALILALIIGCLKLFSFPIGTAIGIYAIWIYSEDQKLSRIPQAK
jgi:ABC-type glycerol-3-phosphate transport system permease component